MDKIKVIKNFISKEDAALIINYIDRNQESFSKDVHGLWFRRFFGLDALYRRGACKGVIEGLEDVRDLCISISGNVTKLLNREFQDSDDIFLNSLWFVKHLPGASVPAHSDLNDGTDYQFVYSSVLYLNNLEKGGELEFPALNISIKTEVGDLVVFPTVGEDMFHGVSSIEEIRYTLPMWFTKDKDLELKFSGE